MTTLAKRPHDKGRAAAPFDASGVLEGLPQAVLVIAEDDRITYANPAAEMLLQASAAILARRTLADIVPRHHPVLRLVEQVRARAGSATEYGLDLSSPALGAHPDVDVSVHMLAGKQGLLLTIIERAVLRALERRHAKRSSARSMVALASLLAHEIKNPLSGIRGAAQLLEADASDEGRGLTRLICEETDRICALVDSMTAFGGSAPEAMAPVNIHAILTHVKQLATAGFAAHIQLVESYDPSLPAMIGHHDQLVQAVLNLVKNAAEAIGEERRDGRIVLGTSYRPGLRLNRSGGSGPTGLPLAVTIADNGPGIPVSIQATLFEPFVTTKARGSGLGLALVAKIIEDHGGLIEIERARGITTVSLLLPLADVAALLPQPLRS